MAEILAKLSCSYVEERNSKRKMHCYAAKEIFKGCVDSTTWFLLAAYSTRQEEGATDCRTAEQKGSGLDDSGNAQPLQERKSPRPCQQCRGLEEKTRV